MILTAHFPPGLPFFLSLSPYLSSTYFFFFISSPSLSLRMRDISYFSLVLLNLWVYVQMLSQLVLTPQKWTSLQRLKERKKKGKRIEKQVRKPTYMQAALTQLCRRGSQDSEKLSKSSEDTGQERGMKPELLPIFTAERTLASCMCLMLTLNSKRENYKLRVKYKFYLLKIGCIKWLPKSMTDIQNIIWKRSLKSEFEDFLESQAEAKWPVTSRPSPGWPVQSLPPSWLFSGRKSNRRWPDALAKGGR